MQLLMLRCGQAGNERLLEIQTFIKQALQLHTLVLSGYTTYLLVVKSWSYEQPLPQLLKGGCAQDCLQPHYAEAESTVFGP